MTRPAIGFQPVRIVTPDCKPGEKWAKWDGQPMRVPQRGELYLSGSVVNAYRAKETMSSEYFIAEPVKEKA